MGRTGDYQFTDQVDEVVELALSARGSAWRRGPSFADLGLLWPRRPPPARLHLLGHQDPPICLASWALLPTAGPAWVRRPSRLSAVRAPTRTRFA